MKPYLIFIEGNNIPHRIHLTRSDAKREANRLAAKFPDKTVYLLQIIRRVQCVNAVVETLGSHQPEPLSVNDLLKGADLYKKQSDFIKLPTVRNQDGKPIVVTIKKPKIHLPQ